jgi:hypothetical protein
MKTKEIDLLKTTIKMHNELGGTLRLRKQADGEYVLSGRDSIGRYLRIKGDKDFIISQQWSKQL